MDEEILIKLIYWGHREAKETSKEYSIPAMLTPLKTK